jgi:two-component system, cell cycle response regulator
MAVVSPSLDTSGSKEEEGPLRVLVVDDDPDSLAALEQAIKLLGHPVEGASNGAEAWEKHCARPAHVIVSDWSMPHMSGVDLCRLVRANADTEYVYFALMTGYGDKAHFLEGMRAGADDYLTKPLDLEELEARLLSATRVVTMQRTLSRQNAMLAEQSDLSFKAARVDTLTESGNRLRLREDLESLEARASRYGHRYSAALCDIDLFKQYNDTYGHLAGDTALRLVASAIAGALRQGDTLYRYGGEEFLVILPEQSADEAARVMDRVRIDVEGLAIAHQASDVGVLTISVGVAELRVGSGSGSQDEWLQRADAALYRAKRSGRNRVEVDGPRSQAVPSGILPAPRARTG